MAKTDGSLRAWVALGGMATVVAVQTNLGCGTTTTEEGTTLAEVDVVSAVLADVGPRVVLPTLDRFLASMDVLDGALGELEAVGGTEGAEKIAAQEAWSDAMSIWQELEVMQLGPAGNSLQVVAGADLRDEIYSWPTINECRVDQVTAAEEWKDADFFTSSLVNAYGMDALEYALFSGEDTDCPGQVPPVSDGMWEELGVEGVAVNRSSLAVALADEVRRQAQGLRDTWDPEGDDFSSQLALSGASPYASSQEALNAIFDALFYVEVMTKDLKLAKPLGLADCSEATCPDDVEGLWGGFGLEAVRANLLGFGQVFQGGDGMGFDDLLEDVGHADLSDEILANLDLALEAVDQVEGPLDEAVLERSEQVQDLYDGVKGVTDLLKGDLATVLALQIPSEAAGDND